MRVLLIANTLPATDVSGAGEQVVQLRAGLEAAGVEVEVLGRGPGGAPGSKLTFPLAVVPAAWRAMRRFRPDVVQVHESDGAFAALLAAALGRFLRPRPRLVALLQVSYREEIRSTRPLVHDGRVLGRPGKVERRSARFKGPLQVVLGRLTARLSEVVLAPSRRTGDEVERDYGVRDVEVLPNVTGAGEAALLAAAAARPPEAAPGYVLYVGRLRIRKGVEVLLEAQAAERDAGRPFRLLLAGDGEHRGALVEKKAALGLDDDATHFLGSRDAASVRALLQGAACLSVPSTYEGMPLVILEAMRAGVPVVASAVSGIPEVVVDGDTGWLVPPEDPPALAAALAAVLGDPEEARRRGEAGRRRALELYTPERAAERWIEVVGRRLGVRPPL